MHYSLIRAAFAAILTVSPVAYADHGDPMPVIAPVSAPAVMHACHLDMPAALGSRGEHVECLQEKLIEQKFLTAVDAPTGYFGTHTRAAVMAWQKAQGLPATGYFGEQSLARWGTPAPSPMPAAHAHEPVSVDAWPAIPSLSIEAIPDALSGYNVHLMVQNFTFAPERVNTPVAAGEGHAHLYVDGVKIGRVYGPWVHVPKEVFKAPGMHLVTVTLNGNDHSELAAAGKHLEATVTVTTQ